MFHQSTYFDFNHYFKNKNLSSKRSIQALVVSLQQIFKIIANDTKYASLDDKLVDKEVSLLRREVCNGMSLIDFELLELVNYLFVFS